MNQSKFSDFGLCVKTELLRQGKSQKWLEDAITEKTGLYGTQFAPEMDEGERIVDSPVPKAEKKVETVADAAMLVLNFGKYSGKTLGEVYKSDIEYISWLGNNEKTDKNIKTAIAILHRAVSEAKRG